MSSKRKNMHPTDGISNRMKDEDNILDRHDSLKTGRDEIERLAYRYWEERGCPEGQDLANWLDAEQAVRAEQRESLQ